MDIGLRDGTAITVASLLMLSLLPLATAVPQPPHTFRGTVYEDGTAVGSGHTVSAYVGGSQVASTTTSSDGSYALDISSDYDGETASFYVDGTDTGTDHTVSAMTVTEDFDLTIAAANQAPSADAGADTSVDENSTVELDGTGSSDPDGTVENYSWTITDDPTGGASLQENATATPVFVAPEDVDADTDVTVRLTVTDNAGATDADNVVVTVANVPAADTTPPTISDVEVATTTDTATITWTTDEPATTEVEYDGATSIDETLTTDHSITLEGLDPGTTYTYQVLSTDEAGNEASSSEDTFTTEEVVVEEVVDHYAGADDQLSVSEVVDAVEDFIEGEYIDELGRQLTRSDIETLVDQLYDDLTG